MHSWQAHSFSMFFLSPLTLPLSVSPCHSTLSLPPPPTAPSPAYHPRLEDWLKTTAAIPAISCSRELRQFIAINDIVLEPPGHNMDADMSGSLPDRMGSPMEFDVHGHQHASSLTTGTSPLPDQPSAFDSVTEAPGTDWKSSPVHKRVHLNDFVLIRMIGKGSFGKVLLVRKKDTDQIYAMKVLAKEHVIKRNQVEHTKTERSVLGYVRHPFIVSLRYAFQSKRKLYFVLDYCPGGELFFHLSKQTRFSENRTRFYAAQMVMALQYLHELGIVYRDLKPENVLLDAQGYVALTDFGLSKEGISDDFSARSFCGTPEYLAPEILTRAGHGRAADWWSLGALIYEMLTGMPPFYSRNRDRLFRKILKANLNLPAYLSNEARSLIVGLLDRNPNTRLGCGQNSASLRSHPFFRSINWQHLVDRKLTAPFIPQIKDLHDTGNFDDEFTSMPLASVEASLQPTHSLVSSVSGGKFAGFTFVDPSVSSNFESSTGVAVDATLLPSPHGVHIEDHQMQRDVGFAPTAIGQGPDAAEQSVQLHVDTMASTNVVHDYVGMFMNSNPDAYAQEHTPLAPTTATATTGSHHHHSASTGDVTHAVSQMSLDRHPVNHPQ
jgi:serine/threonine protein kinase